MYLFDASAIINLLKKEELRVFIKGSTPGLAMYETLNAVWKECFLLKKIRVETTFKLIELLSKVFNILEICSIMRI